jgi:hypothetical protein
VDVLCKLLDFPVAPGPALKRESALSGGGDDEMNLHGVGRRQSFDNPLSKRCA